MRLASLLLRIPDNWIGDLCRATDTSVRILRCAPKNGNGGQSLVRIESLNGVSEDDIVDRVHSVDAESRVNFSRNGSDRLLATVEMRSCSACRALADSNCILDSAASRPDGGIQWNVVAPTGAALIDLVDRLKDRGASVVVEKVTVLRTARELTAEQEMVLQTAFELGYFDIPKKVKLDDLAKRMNISKATLDVVLRRAQRKIVASHIGDS